MTHSIAIDRKKPETDRNIPNEDGSPVPGTDSTSPDQVHNGQCLSFSMPDASYVRSRPAALRCVTTAAPSISLRQVLSLPFIARFRVAKTGISTYCYDDFGRMEAHERTKVGRKERRVDRIRSPGIGARVRHTHKAHQVRRTK